MKLLVVGRSGQIAQALVRTGGPAVLALGRPDLDLTEPSSFAPALRAHAPDIVACVGAYTAVDQAEHEPQSAHRINAEGPGLLARACAEAGLAMIFVSTDYVFDGNKSQPYIETDAIAPQSVYGRTKAEGEARVAANCARHVILRTSWVYDATGRNFVRTMLRLARTRTRVGVVADQFGSPSFADHIAAGLLDIARNLQGPSGLDKYGVFHMSAAQHCSWAQFAQEIFVESAARGGPSAHVDAITSADYPTPAKRPGNSRLNCEKLAAAHCVRLPAWQIGLGLCLDEIAAQGWDRLG